MKAVGEDDDIEKFRATLQEEEETIKVKIIVTAVLKHSLVIFLFSEYAKAVGCFTK